MYVAKIGFNLNKRFELETDWLAKNIHVVLPEPDVLSVERQDFTVLGHDQSFLTSMTPEELATFYSAMDQHAKASIASDKSALSGAIDNLRSDMVRFSSIYGYTVSLSISDEVDRGNDKSKQRTVIEGQVQNDSVEDLNSTGELAH